MAPRQCTCKLARDFTASMLKVRMFLLTFKKKKTHLDTCFIIGFQLMYGANDQLLKDMKIERNPSKYHYIIQGGDPKVCNWHYHYLVG